MAIKRRYKIIGGTMLLVVVIAGGLFQYTTRSALVLADGLIRYSERGQEYVDTLKGIIRVNKLDIADDAIFRDEPVHFLVGAEDALAAEKLRSDIERMRASGEIDEIVARMRLE